MSEKFNPGDRVWAKMDGYPFWPGKIASECITKELREFKDEEDGLAVLFFGKELTYGLVDEDSIVPFDENFDKYSKVKLDESSKHDFDAAIEIASSQMHIEDPPLEMDEEDRVVKKAKKSKKSVSENIDMKKEKLKDSSAQENEEASISSAEEESKSESVEKEIDAKNGDEKAICVEGEARLDITETKGDMPPTNDKVEITVGCTIEENKTHDEISMNIVAMHDKKEEQGSVCDKESETVDAGDN